VLNGAGASGIVFGELPPPVAALVHPHVFNHEAIVQAGLIGDKDLAFRAFLNDPLVGRRPDARTMFEAQRVPATVLAFQHAPAFGCR
jgi:galacturan 1,4-alpha-galacturonidase